MKKKLIRVANQIYVIEQKLHKGENMAANMYELEELVKSLSEEEIWEVNAYLEEKLNRRPFDNK